MGKQLNLNLNAPSTLRDKMKPKTERQVVKFTTSQLRSQGQRKMKDAERVESTDGVQQSLFIDNELGARTEHTQEYETVGGAVRSTLTKAGRDARHDPKAERSVQDTVSSENERMTRRQADVSKNGKDRTERTGSSVRVLNRIALYEVGHGLNGGGTRPEVKDAADWQSEFKSNENRSGAVVSTSRDGGFHKYEDSGKSIVGSKPTKDGK